MVHEEIPTLSGIQDRHTSWNLTLYPWWLFWEKKFHMFRIFQPINSKVGAPNPWEYKNNSHIFLFLSLKWTNSVSGKMASLVRCLPCNHEDPDLGPWYPYNKKSSLWLAAHTCNPSSGRWGCRHRKLNGLAKSVSSSSVTVSTHKVGHDLGEAPEVNFWPPHAHTLTSTFTTHSCQLNVNK